MLEAIVVGGISCDMCISIIYVCCHSFKLCWMVLITLVGIVHHMVAIKGTMIALATYLASRVRSLIIIGLVIGIVIVGIPYGTKLIAGRVTTSASGRVASVVLGSKVLAVWIDSWREPWFLKVGKVLMVEVWTLKGPTCWCTRQCC